LPFCTRWSGLPRCFSSRRGAPFPALFRFIETALTPAARLAFDPFGTDGLPDAVPRHNGLA